MTTNWANWSLSGGVSGNVFWSLYPVWCVLLVSFENQAAGNILGVPQFRKDLSSIYDGDYALDTN